MDLDIEGCERQRNNLLLKGRVANWKRHELWSHAYL